MRGSLQPEGSGRGFPSPGRSSIDLRLAGAVWMRNYTVYRRTWLMNVLPNFFEPVIYLVGMGIGLGAYVKEGMSGGSYIAYIAPGLMASAAMNGASFETTFNTFVKLHFGKLYDAYLGTPAEPEDIVAGEAMWAVTRALGYGIGFLAVLGGLTLAGYPILTSPWALLLPLAATLTGAAFAAMGLLFTSFIETIDLYSYYFTLFITPLFLFSGIFYDVKIFAGAEKIAWCTPLYHAVRLHRGLAHGPLTSEIAVSAAWLLAMTVAIFLVVPGRFRRRLIK